VALPGSPRVAVSILISNLSGAVLLQLRDAAAPVCPNVWGTVGGGVEAGESPDDAAARELAEETGLTEVALAARWVMELPADSGSGTTVRHVYTATADLTDHDITVGEGADIRFVPRDRLLDRPMTPATRTVLTRFLADSLRDYEQWHRGYDDPNSGLSWRLRTARQEITEFLDGRPGPVRVLSACAGDGRDVIGVLRARPDAARVRATLVEINAGLCVQARRAAAGLHVDVREGDAGSSDTYLGSEPADLVLLIGIFGNVDDTDLFATIAAAPELCAPRARLLWSRGRDIDGSGDRNGAIRTAFADAGFTELRYHVHDAPDGSRPALGVVSYHGPSRSLASGRRWFTFRR
jgi:8-oxo-dGTP pyrophosphatase MutT (NUDIX family)